LYSSKAAKGDGCNLSEEKRKARRKLTATAVGIKISLVLMVNVIERLKGTKILKNRLPKKAVS